jgi:nitrilase
VNTQSTLTIALAQISPIWLNKEKTIDKIKSFIMDAGNQKCELVVFGEALLPGYPFWLSLTNGAEFNSSVQKNCMHITSAVPFK